MKCTRLRDGRAVRDTLCRPEERPKELETWCPTDCPVDCEVSPWTPWDLSACQCGRESNQMTRKRMISTEASPSGRPCPAVMEEARPCPSRPCYTLVESASLCDLQGASCGVGTIRHNLTCIRVRVGTTATASDQPPPEADMNSCQESLPFAGTFTDDVCFTSCPTDCVLSEWTSWSECQGPCVGTKTSKRLFLEKKKSVHVSYCFLLLAAGTRTRRRNVNRAAVRPHGQCLSELVQRQPCLLDPCYTYTSIVDGEAEAAATTEAICIRSDGLIVDGKLHQSSTCPKLNLHAFHRQIFVASIFCGRTESLLP